MDREPLLTDVPRVLVQRRHVYRAATLALSAHGAAVLFDPPGRHAAAAPAEDAALPCHAAHADRPRASVYTAAPGDRLVFSFHLIGRATRLPSVAPPQAYAVTLGPSPRAFPIWIQLKSFEALTLYFSSDQACQNVFRSIRTCAVLQHVEELAAFHPDPLLSLPAASTDEQEPQSPDGASPAGVSGAGWDVYDPQREFERQGVWSRTRAWRTTSLNSSHAFCPTYPSMLVVPVRISDATLQHGARFRSKCRIPVLTYLHWAHLATITRSSQPLVGLRYSRSVQDEKLVDAIFSSHLCADGAPSSASLSPSDPSQGEERPSPDTGGLGGFDAIESSEALSSLPSQPVYGARTNNVIIDARPTTNAYANHAKGAGSETMDYYPGCSKVFLGIDNIHVMRDSLKAMTEALTDADVAPGFGAEGQERLPSLDTGQLKRSGWLKHISTLLEGAGKIVRTVHVDCAHVLIHCSDGWDRTSQLSALAQVCLDPYFRTFDGFAVLIEKDFAAFGHRFLDRTGHLSHKTFFDDKYIASPESESDSESRNGGFEPANAASALWGFTKSVAANLRGPQDQESVTHRKEISPVFHQFLDCVYQLHRQFPQRFEFDTGWLVELQRALHECTTGTFVFNSEADRMHCRRRFPGVKSVWGDLLSPATKEAFTNSRFDPELDDVKRPKTDMGVLMPDGKDVRFWPALFRRSDEDLNAHIDAERAAQKEAASQRDVRRRRLEQRLEAAAHGAHSSDGPPGKDLASDTDEYGALAYRPYQPKKRHPFPHILPRPHANGAHSLPPEPPSRSDDQGWDPAAAGKRQVRALWTASRGWLFGDQPMADVHQPGLETQPWASDGVRGRAPAPMPIPRALGNAGHERADSTSSWERNVWSKPQNDLLSTGLQNIQLSASSPPVLSSPEQHTTRPRGASHDPSPPSPVDPSTTPRARAGEALDPLGAFWSPTLPVDSVGLNGGTTAAPPSDEDGPPLELLESTVRDLPRLSPPSQSQHTAQVTTDPLGVL